MDNVNLLSQAHQFMQLQDLIHKRKLEEDLKTQMELLNSMKKCLTISEEITSLPNTFCDIVAQKDEPFLEIDSKSGKCFRDIKKIVLERSTKNTHDSCEVKFPIDLEQSSEQSNLEIQEQREKFKTWNCLLDNHVRISDNMISDETINIDDISSIKTDSSDILAQNLFTASLIDMDESNQTIKDMY